MKNAEVLTVSQAIERFDMFDLILDARSPAEFALDHLPGAHSTPVLDDAQRAQVGTMYKQVGAFEAKRIGAALVARNIADTLEGALANVARDARLLVYCWRGGNRSGALATVLARVGWRTAILDGGYRAFRRHVLEDLRTMPAGLHLVVIAGRTGSGKSLILQRLQTLGAQVLDLELLASHRGSVLGHLPERAQPSQKHFESMLWATLRAFNPARPVFVESESRKVGQCQVPAELIEAMRNSPCIRIDANDAVRCELLLSEYRHFVENPDHLVQRLAALVDHHGKARIEDWITKARSGKWEAFVLDLLHQHYDPAYDRSMARNYRLIAEARSVTLSDASESSLIDAARDILASSEG
jgi:tRNA 2-selenouridine synthase